MIDRGRPNLPARGTKRDWKQGAWKASPKMWLLVAILLLLLLFGGGAYVLTSNLLLVIIVVVVVMALAGYGGRGRWR